MNEKKYENPAAIRSKRALALAFAELLEKKSLPAITISEITEKAGVSRQTFYTNFSQKEDILTYSLDRLFSMYADQLPEGLFQTPLEALADYFTYWHDHSQFLTLLFRNSLGYLFLMANNACFENEFQTLAASLSECAEDIPFILSGLSGITFSILRTWILNGASLPAEALLSTAQKLLTGYFFKTGGSDNAV